MCQVVKDWVLGMPLPAQEATYVISSSIIPDMLPNIIAFKEPEEAKHFKEENGGEIITFSQALLIISPAAMTMPARIKTAVLPSRGASGVALGVMTMTMDKVKLGSDSVDPIDFIQRPGQKMGPNKMEMYTMGGKKTVTTKNNGPSDTFVSYRYNLFKSVYYDRNERNGNDVGNSGGTRSMLTGVASWRFLTALGGNFNLRLTTGIPLYEDLNHSTGMMGGETVQLGGGWFSSLSLSFKRRYAPHH